jgi:hypothetical protein
MVFAVFVAIVTVIVIAIALPGLQHEFKVWHAEQLACALRPFNQAHRVAIKIIPKPRIGPFGWVVKTVQVKMIKMKLAMRCNNVIRLNERIGRAAHARCVAKRAQYGPHEGGLACAEVALQMHLQAGV